MLAVSVSDEAGGGGLEAPHTKCGGYERTKIKNGVITKFSFMFNSNLHIEDLDVLKNISRTHVLDMGVVTTDTKSGRNLCTYRINKQSASRPLA